MQDDYKSSLNLFRGFETGGGRRRHPRPKNKSEPLGTLVQVGLKMQPVLGMHLLESRSLVQVGLRMQINFGLHLLGKQTLAQTGSKMQPILGMHLLGTKNLDQLA